MKRIAINGLGRIGRAVFKLIIEEEALEIVAVNDLLDADHLAYLLNYDTVYGRYSNRVSADGATLVVGDRRIQVLSERDPAKLPWKDLDIDLVVESTGLFTEMEKAKAHLLAGAKQVAISAPTKSPELATAVHGVAHPESKEPRIFSCASCTTNSITPVVEVMGRRIGVKKAVLTTVHAYTASQQLVDSPSKKRRTGRAAAQNIVPSSTGAAIATTKVLPEYAGKFDGRSLRVPVPVGSISDITFVTERTTSVDEINASQA
jgi:Glyceraldehyde-3-phosphate dehydrogenase/erythrose-4-phosphate dehydrogenase